MDEEEEATGQAHHAGQIRRNRVSESSRKHLKHHSLKHFEFEKTKQIFRWRWLYYTSVFLYGVLALWNKPWLWDIRYCWYNYPR